MWVEKEKLWLNRKMRRVLEGKNNRDRLTERFIAEARALVADEKIKANKVKK
jgi:hypothetical protein